MKTRWKNIRAIAVTILALATIFGLGFWQLRAVAAFQFDVLLKQREGRWHDSLARVLQRVARQEARLFDDLARRSAETNTLADGEDTPGGGTNVFILRKNGDISYPPSPPARSPAVDLTLLGKVEAAGNTLQESPSNRQAIAVLNKVVSQKRSGYAGHRAHLLLATLDRQAGELALAAEHYERAAEYSPDDRTCLGCLIDAGRMHEQAGQNEQAGNAYRQAIKLASLAVKTPDDIAWASGYRDEALLFLKKAGGGGSEPEAPWARALARAAVRERLHGWIIPAILKTAPGSAANTLVAANGDAVARVRAMDVNQGIIAGYFVNIPALAANFGAGLGSEVLRVEILLPSGLAIAATGRARVYRDQGGKVFALDPILEGFGLRITADDSDIRRRVAQHVAVVGSTLFVAFALIGVGLGALWRGMRKQAELANLKSEFISNVSHELKTPLALIRMIGDSLRLGRVPDDERKMKYFDILSRESRRLTALIDNVLDFSRIDSGRKQYAFGRHNPREIAESLMETYRPHLEEKGFVIRFEAPEASHVPVIRLDPAAYSLVLVNLLDNAEKFSDDRKGIDVRIAVESDMVVTEVADRGIGVPDADRSHIFERFHRSAEAVQRQIRGTGIGLSLVRHVAEAHGGTVAVRPREGGGSVFSLRLPVNAAPDGQT